MVESYGISNYKTRVVCLTTATTIWCFDVKTNAASHQSHLDKFLTSLILNAPIPRLRCPLGYSYYNIRVLRGTLHAGYLIVHKTYCGTDEFNKIDSLIYHL